MAAELLEGQLWVKEGLRCDSDELAEMMNGVEVGEGRGALLFLEKGEGQDHVGKKQVETALEMIRAWQCNLELRVDGRTGARRMPIT